MVEERNFGIVVYGYGLDTSYMYPGGLNLETIVIIPIEISVYRSLLARRFSISRGYDPRSPSRPSSAHGGTRALT